MKSELYEFACKVIQEKCLNHGDSFKVFNVQSKTRYGFLVDSKGCPDLQWIDFDNPLSNKDMLDYELFEHKVLDEYKIDHIPDGWRKVKGALTAPIGWVWYCNGKSRFSGNKEYEHALVPEELTKVE